MKKSFREILTKSEFGGPIFSPKKARLHPPGQSRPSALAPSRPSSSSSPRPFLSSPPLSLSVSQRSVAFSSFAHSFPIRRSLASQVIVFSFAFSFSSCWLGMGCLGGLLSVPREEKARLRSMQICSPRSLFVSASLLLSLFLSFYLHILVSVLETPVDGSTPNPPLSSSLCLYVFRRVCLSVWMRIHFAMSVSFSFALFANDRPGRVSLLHDDAVSPESSTPEEGYGTACSVCTPHTRGGVRIFFRSGQLFCFSSFAVFVLQKSPIQSLTF